MSRSSPAIGGFLAGFEHQDGWGGADRGLVGGAIYGAALLVAHAIAGTHAKVSLGSFPPLLAVVTAIVGMFLGAAGGRIARGTRARRRERQRGREDKPGRLMAEEPETAPTTSSSTRTRCPVAASALRLLISDEAHEPQIRAPRARGARRAGGEPADERGNVTVGAHGRGR